MGRLLPLLLLPLLLLQAPPCTLPHPAPHSSGPPPHQFSLLLHISPAQAPAPLLLCRCAVRACSPPSRCSSRWRLMPAGGPRSSLGASPAAAPSRSASTSRTAASSPPRPPWTGSGTPASCCWMARRCVHGAGVGVSHACVTGSRFQCVMQMRGAYLPGLKHPAPPPTCIQQGAFSVEPGRGVTYTVQFTPGAEGDAASHELRLNVAHNPYEDYCIALSGEGYQVGAWRPVGAAWQAPLGGLLSRLHALCQGPLYPTPPCSRLLPRVACRRMSRLRACRTSQRLTSCACRTARWASHTKCASLAVHWDVTPWNLCPSD